MFQNYQQNAFQNQLGSSSGGSQYRGLETKYQPVGNVQSQYNQSLGLGNQSGFQNNSLYNQNIGQTQFPTSVPTGQSQFGTGFGNTSTSFNNAGSSFGYQNQYAQQTPESFHTASYRGNQPGHDAYLRADSTQPAQSQFGIGAANSYNTGMNSQFGLNQQNQNLNQNQFPNQYQNQNQNQIQSNQSYNQFQNPQSFHTANYRGNQQGHDAYLRADKKIKKIRKYQEK